MLTDDELQGIRKPDWSGVKEIKVRVPARFLVNLHYLKLTRRRLVSALVNEALEAYFEKQGLPRSRPPASEHAAPVAVPA